MKSTGMSYRQFSDLLKGTKRVILNYLLRNMDRETRESYGLVGSVERVMGRHRKSELLKMVDAYWFLVVVALNNGGVCLRVSKEATFRDVKQLVLRCGGICDERCRSGEWDVDSFQMTDYHEGRLRSERCIYADLEKLGKAGVGSWGYLFAEDVRTGWIPAMVMYP